MPAFEKIQSEIGNKSPTEEVRRKYLAKLHKKTGRDTILYASGYSVKDVPSQVSSITSQDVQFFMSAVHGLKSKSLDLIVHSPGGSADATEQIVNYLRAKFDDIRVIVPQSAMSAATMLACAANRIVMGKHSALGPIDPQVPTTNGLFPAQSILDEYDMAKDEIKTSPHSAALWANKIMQFPPGLLIVCKNQVERAKSLVEQWLQLYMFAGDGDAAAKAAEIGKWLGEHGEHLTHGKPIGIELAKQKKLVVDPLESDQDFQDLVMSIFHATVCTFLGGPVVKVVENHKKGGMMLIQK